MIRSIIIDDESPARNALRELLKTHADRIEVVGEAADIEEAVSAIRALEPDLIFLDVQLGAELGFDLLAQFPSPSFEVIFVSAYDRYAVQAIRFAALDFITKPVDPLELKAGLGRVETELKEKRGRERFQLLQDHLTGRNQGQERIVLPHPGGFEVVQVSDIAFCKADGNYTEIHFVNGQKTLVSRILKYYDETLTELGFFRCHQSYLVNLATVKSYQRRKKGGAIALSNGIEIPLAERAKSAFQQLFLG